MLTEAGKKKIKILNKSDICIFISVRYFELRDINCNYKSQYYMYLVSSIDFVINASHKHVQKCYNLNRCM